MFEPFELPKFDPDLFKDCKSANKHINYSLYRENEQSADTLRETAKLKLVNNVKSDKAACFYSMRGLINASNPKYDRVCVSIDIHETLSKKDAERWLNLCKEHKFLADYVPVKTVVDRGTSCIAIDQHTYNQVYIYLSVIRFLQDEPGYVKAALIFMDHGMLFIPAVLAAATISVGNSNHHFLKPRHCTGHTYKDVSKLNEGTVFVQGLVGLHRFINQHDKYNNPATNGSYFNCNQNIDDAACKQINTENLYLGMLLHPGIGLLFHADTDIEVAVCYFMLTLTSKWRW